MEKLLFHLVNLHGGHSAAVRRQFGSGLLTHCEQLSFGGGGEENGEELFFEHSERLLQFLQLGRRVSHSVSKGVEPVCNLGQRSVLFRSVELLRGCFQMGSDPFLFKTLRPHVSGFAGAAPTAASCIASMAEITSWAQYARPFTRRTRVLFFRASYLSKAISMPLSTAASGMPASRQVSISAQSMLRKRNQGTAAALKVFFNLV